MCVVIDEYNRFFGSVWSRSVETAYEEEVGFLPNAAPLTIGPGAVE